MTDREAYYSLVIGLLDIRISIAQYHVLHYELRERLSPKFSHRFQRMGHSPGYNRGRLLAVYRRMLALFAHQRRLEAGTALEKILGR